MRGPRAANLSTRDPPPAEAERAEKVPRADKQRLAGGPTTPPSSPHPHLSERKGDQQAVHRLPRVPKQAPLQRDPGRCRLHPRGPRSGGEVEPLTTCSPYSGDILLLAPRSSRYRAFAGDERPPQLAALAASLK